MREKYESLSLMDLKEIAKARGLKGISTMKKAEIINLMCEKDEEEKRSDGDFSKTQSAEKKTAPAAPAPAAAEAGTEEDAKDDGMPADKEALDSGLIPQDIPTLDRLAAESIDEIKRPAGLEYLLGAGKVRRRLGLRV